MKKILLLLAILITSALTAHAQDYITTIDRTVIRAKVLEVSPTVVKYKKESNPDGPTYTIYTSDLISILYANGEQDIFNEALANAEYSGSPYAPIPSDGLKYRHYKNAYNPRMYVRQWGDPYSPGWSGIASAVIPGFGQALCDEWGRAAGFFFGSLTLGCAAAASANWDSYGLDYRYYIDVESNGASSILGLASLGLYIWGICDAVRVAKVKNMRYQDLRSRTAGDMEVKLEPFVSSTPKFQAHGFGTVAGVAVRVSF